MRLFTRFGRMVPGCLLALIITGTATFANQVKLNDQPNELRVLDNSGQGFRVSLNFSEFNTLDVKTTQGIFTRLLVPAFARSGEYGHPELPVKSELIEIPFNASVEVHIINQSFKDYNLMELGISNLLMPNQPPVSKSQDPVSFAFNNQAYQADAYTPAGLAGVEGLGIMRGVNIGRLDIFPVQYNPAKGIVRIYETLEIEISFIDGDLAATEQSKLTYGNHYFQPVFNSLINYREPQNAGRENLSRYPIKFVIVSDPMFETQLQPFIEWKTRKGFTVIEAYTNDPNVGTTTFQIKAYLQSLYNAGTPEDPAPTYVLFVGDIAQVPTWTGQAAGHVTDLYYCEYTNDYFPEMFYGRFSAQNPDQLQPQIDKTLMYEQYTMPTTSYLDTVVMIAGMDGTFGPTHGNGQINYGTINYFNASNGIYSHTYLYPGSGSNAANIRQNISDGVTFANYTAHGSPSGWADPSFTTGHIPALQNQDKYGLLVGNCCSTSEYQVGECFAEAIVRVANKGAVGYIGASNSTYWDEDYYFGVGVGAISGNPPSYEQTTLGYYDRAFHTHGEPFGEWYTTTDQMIYAGNLAVTEGSPSMARYYWEAYCLMGDPSLMVYFSEPPVMMANYDPMIPLGSQTFTVNTVPYAYVALSMNNTAHGAALADASGLAVITITGTVVPGMADVVITAQNFQPFQGQVLIANPEGPYVMLEEFLVDDELGNNNGLIDYNEDIKLDVALKNWGSAASENSQATLSTADQYITITDDVQDYGTIEPEAVVTMEGAFEFTVEEFIPDMHNVEFQLEIQGTGREVWNSTFSVTLYAPVMTIGTLVIDDATGGNGNGRLDAGETVDLVLACHNTGHSDAYDALATLQSASPYITILNNNVTIGDLPAEDMAEAVFTITLDEEIETGTIIALNFDLSSGPYNATSQFNPKVGLILEDFESGNLEAYEWYTGGNLPWQITTQGVYEGAYSVRSGAITHSQTSELMIDLLVTMNDSISFYRKVSCEDGSSNNYDWLAFYIDGVEKGRWDGEVAWSRLAYPVTAGQHTFKWLYSKDNSVSSGEDVAKIDYIVFPPSMPPGPVVVLNEYIINDELGNNNGMIDFGEDIMLDVELKNMGGGDALDVSATISTADEYVTITDDSQEFGTIASQGFAMQEDAYQFSVADMVPDMHQVEFMMEIEGSAEREIWTSSFTVTLFAPVMTIGTLFIMDVDGGNGNYALDAGETADLVLNCHNTGHCDALAVLTTLQSSSPYITIHNNSVEFDTLLWNGMRQAVFSVTLAEVIETGTVIDLNFELSSGPYMASGQFNPQVGMIVENFEKGTFFAYGWYHEGNMPWEITSEGVYEGNFAAKSGAILHNQTSELLMDLTVGSDDSISFYRRVSCESNLFINADWLSFYIDELEMGRWDGETNWARVSYPVAAGQHTMKWVYKKNSSVSSGADAAWIDYIIFPGSTQSVSVGELNSGKELRMDIYPNPSRGYAKLYVHLEEESLVTFKIYDLTGEKVMDVVSEQLLQSGSHQFGLNLESLKAGMYFCKLQAGNQQITQKLVISK